MRPPTRFALLSLAIALTACSRAGDAPAVPAPASGVETVAAGTAAATSALPLPVPVVELKGSAALAVLGSASAVLDAGGETTVAPGTTFRVELPLPLVDARLSLLDGGEAMVPSSGVREFGQVTVLTLAPAVALAAGARLRLRVDGAAMRELLAGDGRHFAPLEWRVVVAGDSDPRKSAIQKRKRR
jgi:hypothetical protein